MVQQPFSSSRGSSGASADGGYVSPSINAPHLTTQELEQLDESFAKRVSQARHGGHRLSRLRLWLLFLLVRHGGLRLGEALNLHDERDLDLDSGVVRVQGTHAREVPLPRPLLPRLREMLAEATAMPKRGTLCHLDPGYVRRNFYARARECSLPPELASPRALRQSRAVELLQGGMPLPAVQGFLGQPSLEATGDLLAYSQDDIQSMTRHFLKREAQMKTSARNVFPGEVTAIRHSGFLVEMSVRSFTGLDLVAIITEESLENLHLALGKTVIATVKAPWVILGRSDTDTSLSARNAFAGNVERITHADVLCEVVVELFEGSRACALITTPSLERLNLVQGSPVKVLFKALAVILTLP